MATNWLRPGVGGLAPGEVGMARRQEEEAYNRLYPRQDPSAYADEVYESRKWGDQRNALMGEGRFLGYNTGENALRRAMDAEELNALGRGASRISKFLWDAQDRWGSKMTDENKKEIMSILSGGLLGQQITEGERLMLRKILETSPPYPGGNPGQ